MVFGLSYLCYRYCITFCVLYFLLRKLTVWDCKQIANAEMADRAVTCVSFCKPLYLSTDILNMLITLVFSYVKITHFRILSFTFKVLLKFIVSPVHIFLSINICKLLFSHATKLHQNSKVVCMFHSNFKSCGIYLRQYLSSSVQQTFLPSSIITRIMKVNGRLQDMSYMVHGVCQ
jgi:hypothetical protein